MSRWPILLILLSGFTAATASELSFDLGNYPLNQIPPGFRSTVTGLGKAGDWKILADEAPTSLKSFTAAPSSVARRNVLAQTAEDKTDEHFPVLIYDNDIYGDFTFTTLFKLVSGTNERMAGIAFRIQDERNYYVIRASGLGNNVRFYKFVAGERSQPIGPEIPISSGVWHELSVECKGNKIRCLLDGKEALPQLTDNSFAAGKIGFWTKSDSVSYFAEPHITYTPRIPTIQTVVKNTKLVYTRLLGLKVFANRPGATNMTAVASIDEKDLGQPAPSEAVATVANDAAFFGRDIKTVTVTLPLHDRNGEAIAAVWVVMESFIGQTEDNAVSRARPVVKAIEENIKTARDMFE